MGVELSLMTLLTRRLPRVRGAGVLANGLWRVYKRKPREKVISNVLGFEMQLDPRETVDAGLLFYPQLYDYHEIDFIRENLEDGDTFVDGGAHIGFYSLVASQCVGRAGRVIAVEAEPVNYSRLCLNLEMNEVRNVLPLEMGIAAKRETLSFGVSSSGNRGGSSFLKEHEGGFDVQCCSLLNILEDNDVSRVKGIKLDLEGFEYRVLRSFFSEAPETLYPEFITLEFNSNRIEMAGGNAIELLEQSGYRVFWRSQYNHIMLLS